MRKPFTAALLGLVFLPVAPAMAEPFGYSINSDAGVNGDHLHRIDLATGQSTDIGLVQALGVTRLDVEGLAFDANGKLWGMDEQSMRLFPIDTNSAQVQFQSDVNLFGFAALRGNDFGLTFTCEGDLYASSVTSTALYRVSLTGVATQVGNMGVRISALAAWGLPSQLYGLGNGLLGEGGAQDNRSLYRIDPQTGATELIGNVGPEVADYFEAGLSFDDAGTLWAITDRRTSQSETPSQLLQLDTETGAATVIATTSQAGFESLAVAGPGGCDVIQFSGPGPIFEGIPTLDSRGRILAVLLLLLGGLVALRGRFPI